MATNGQFCWPSVGSSVAAYGQFGMAANNRDGLELLARHRCTRDGAWVGQALVPRASRVSGGFQDAVMGRSATESGFALTPPSRNPPRDCRKGRI